MNSQLTLTWLVEGALLAILLAGCRIVTGSVLMAALIAAPVALLVPWQVPLPLQDSASLLPPMAALLWLWCLLYQMPRVRRGMTGLAPMALAALVSTWAVLRAPQMLLLLAFVTSYSALQTTRPRSLAPLVSMFAIPLGYYACATAFASGGEGLGNAAATFGAAVARGWSSRPWFQQQGSHVYRDAVFQLNALFYLPLLPALAALAIRHRHQWWFGPTLVWSAVLVAAPMVLEGNFHFHYSQPMQMGLLIASGIIAARQLRAHAVRPYEKPHNEFGDSRQRHRFRKVRQAPVTGLSRTAVP